MRERGRVEESGKGKGEKKKGMGIWEMGEENQKHINMTMIMIFYDVIETSS